MAAHAAFEGVSYNLAEQPYEIDADGRLKEKSEKAKRVVATSQDARIWFYRCAHAKQPTSDVLGHSDACLCPVRLVALQPEKELPDIFVQVF